MGEINWPIVLGCIAIMVGVLLTPYELLHLIQRIWEQRRRERIARGEDVQPHRPPWHPDDRW